MDVDYYLDGYSNTWECFQAELIRQFEAIKHENDSKGIGNGHVISNAEFIDLVDNSNSSPCTYLNNLKKKSQVIENKKNEEEGVVSEDETYFKGGRKMNCVMTPMDWVGCGAVVHFQSIKYRNNLNGIGNSHVISDDEFLDLFNDPKSDPSIYLSQIEMKIQELLEELEKNQQEGHLPAAALSDEHKKEENQEEAHLPAAAVVSDNVSLFSRPSPI